MHSLVFEDFWSVVHKLVQLISSKHLKLLNVPRSLCFSSHYYFCLSKRREGRHNVCRLLRKAWIRQGGDLPNSAVIWRWGEVIFRLWSQRNHRGLSCDVTGVRSCQLAFCFSLYLKSFIGLWPSGSSVDKASHELVFMQKSLKVLRAKFDTNCRWYSGLINIRFVLVHKLVHKLVQLALVLKQVIW